MIGCLFAAAASAGGDGEAEQGAAKQQENAPPLAKLLERVEPTPPEEAIQTFQVRDGYELELVAAEPQVTDPIALTFDAAGRMYAAEMRDYPYPPKKGEKPKGRIRRLTDPDGDGRYEKSTVFAEHVPWPSGVACWDGGVYVTSAPDIWYLKDTDGDGRADERRKVYTGFEPHHAYSVVNTLRWGPDNRIYGAASYSGGHVRRPDQPESEAIALRNNDFRFDPRGGLDPVSGSGEFGNAFDNRGNRFVCTAPRPLLHPVLPRRYIAANPNLVVRTAVDQIGGLKNRVHPISDPEPWRVVRKRFWQRWVGTSHDMRARRFPEKELAPQGYVTAASGVAICRGGAYGRALRGDALVGEPANNLLLRFDLTPKGATFQAERPHPKEPFLASTDIWFRPVNMTNGPGGCLYIADMYRHVIEDPSAIPQDILDHLDMSDGIDRGRVYRLVPERFDRPDPPALTEAGAAELAAAIRSPHAWRRQTAQRLLLERSAGEAASELRRIAQKGKLAASRLQAIWTLRGLGRLETPTLTAALDDAAPSVRAHAVRLVEAQSAESDLLKSGILRLAKDPSPRVRFQAALSASTVSGPRRVEALAKIAKRDVEHRWIRTAVALAATDRSAALFERLAADGAFLEHRLARGILSKLAEAVGARNATDEVRRVLRATAAMGPGPHQPRTKQAIVGNLARGVQRGGGRLAAHREGWSAPAVERMLRDLAKDVRRKALDRSKGPGPRTHAIDYLGLIRTETSRRTLVELLHPSEPEPVQRKALRALSRLGGEGIGPIIAERWSSYSPKLRAIATEALFRDADRLPALLDAIESGAVARHQLSPQRREALRNHERTEVRRRARELLGQRVRADRKQLVRQYRRDLTEHEGEAAEGRSVFRRTCAICHRARGIGSNVGPDLTKLNDRSTPTLLIHILDPNRRVEAKYLTYRVTRKDGSTLTGVIASESSNSITVRMPGGAERTVLRKNVESVESTGESLMPEGLEEAIPPDQMADLVRYLQSL